MNLPPGAGRVCSVPLFLRSTLFSSGSFPAWMSIRFQTGNPAQAWSCAPGPNCSAPRDAPGGSRTQNPRVTGTNQILPAESDARVRSSPPSCQLMGTQGFCIATRGMETNDPLLPKFLG